MWRQRYKYWSWYSAGYTLTTGDNNTFIGSDSSSAQQWLLGNSNVSSLLNDTSISSI